MVHNMKSSVICKQLNLLHMGCQKLAGVLQEEILQSLKHMQVFVA